MDQNTIIMTGNTCAARHATEDEITKFEKETLNARLALGLSEAEAARGLSTINSQEKK